MSKYIELAKKLKALADKGIDGEKANAQKMLDALMKKHNLTIEDIEGEKTEDYFFKLKSEDEQLWQQIVKRVNRKIKAYGKFPTKDMNQFHLKGNFMITCTASEYVEIGAMFAIYIRLYNRELDVFYRAFCTANDLLVQADPDKMRSVLDLTPDELKDHIRSQQMAENIKKETYRRQINSTNP